VFRRGPSEATVLTCDMCGETKAQADFAFADIAKGTRQRHCRKCQAAYRRAHYLANRDTYIRREVARINAFRIENRALMLAYLLAHPCIECGETNPVMLDFDHRDPSTKSGNIGSIAARKPWHLVLPEIEKCDVRCANCHMRRTAEQQNWRKARKEPIAQGPWLLRQLPQGQPLSVADQTRATKVCTGCGLERPITEFPVKHKKRGTRATRCRTCRSSYGKGHYQRNRDKYIAKAKRRRPRERDTYWAWLMTYLQLHPCVDCGETDPVVLTFDHRDNTEKVDTIGRLLSRSGWTPFLAEVAKCDVRCANCHRVRTAEQFNWSKWIRESA
jgi:hypothetical protein